MTKRTLILRLLSSGNLDEEVIFQTGPAIHQRESIQDITYLRDLKLWKLHGDYQESILVEMAKLCPDTHPDCLRSWLNESDWNLERAIQRFREPE